MRVIIPAVLVAAALAIPTESALAHAQLVNAQPAVGSTVTVAPKDVVIRFSEGVEPRFSSIHVENAAGQRVDDGAPSTAPDDAKRFTVQLKPLTPGVYKVIWHATSVDTHKTEGTFQFTLQP